MPIPTNWVEELATEWLSIEGFMAESNVRLIAGKRGGVPEADVIGAKVENNVLKIIHIETGALAQGLEKNVEDVRRKFEDARRKTVEAILKEGIAWDGEVDYEAIYIASYAGKADELKGKLEGDKVEFLMLEKFIEEKVLRTIKNWKQKQIAAGRRKTKDITFMTLPACYWLLSLLDFLYTKGILKKRKPAQLGGFGDSG